MKVKIRKNLILRYVEKSDVDILYYDDPNKIGGFYVLKKNSMQNDDDIFVSAELAEKPKNGGRL